MTEEEIKKIRAHIEIHARREPPAVKITQILWKAVEELEATQKLQEENEKLKEVNNILFNATSKVGKKNNELLEENKQAKEIIRALYIAIRDGDEGVYNSCKDSFIKAEAFINKE